MSYHIRSANFAALNMIDNKKWIHSDHPKKMDVNGWIHCIAGSVCFGLTKKETM